MGPLPKRKRLHYSEPLVKSDYIKMMHFDKKSYLYRIIKVSAIVVTALLSVVLIYAAYSGTTHPAESRIAPVAVLAFLRWR